jgi:opacity protein-like surface antigen
LNLGYNIISRERVNLFAHAGVSGNYLLNSYYGLGGYKKYEGSYKKNNWNGVSVNVGVGGDYRISEKWKATARVGYSVVNKTKEDEYLYSQDEYGLRLPHEFLRLSIGARMML